MPEYVFGIDCLGSDEGSGTIIYVESASACDVTEDVHEKLSRRKK
jgi:hypothetical protein